MAFSHAFSIQKTDARHNMTRGNRNTSKYQQNNNKDRTHSASLEQHYLEFLFFTEHCDATRLWCQTFSDPKRFYGLSGRYLLRSASSDGATRRMAVLAS
jgi:hypothetical protein